MSAHDLTNDESVGFAIVNLYLNENNFSRDDYPVGMPNPLKSYGFDPSDRNKVELEYISNRMPKKYKNVGVVLIKSILQYCMLLNALQNSTYRARIKAFNFERKHNEFI